MPLFGLTEGITRTFGQSPFSTAYIVPAVLGIIGILLLILIIVTVIQLGKGRPAKVLMGPIDLYKPPSPVVVDRDTTLKNMSATYTISFFLTLDAVPDMRAGVTPLLTWAGVWNLGYATADETLVWSFGQTPISRFSVDKPERIFLPQVPLQRCTQVTMTFEGRSVDLYVNGTLIKSTILENLPGSNTSSVTIVGNGIIGKISYIQVWPRRLTVPEVANNYLETSDSQGCPYLGPELLKTIGAISLPNLFCPSGNCSGTAPVATQSQVWEFPYA